MDRLLINVDDSPKEKSAVCFAFLIWYFFFGWGWWWWWCIQCKISCVFRIFDSNSFGGGLLYNERFIIDTIDNYRSILSTSFLIFQSYHKVVEVMASNQKVAVVYCDLDKAHYLHCLSPPSCNWVLAYARG